MTAAPLAQPAALAPGSDATAAFRAAYENRYTWAPGTLRISSPTSRPER